MIIELLAVYRIKGPAKIIDPIGSKGQPAKNANTTETRNSAAQLNQMTDEGCSTLLLQIILTHAAV